MIEPSEAVEREIDSPGQHQISTRQVTLNVRSAGTGPLAVLLHGVTANAAVWDPVLARLCPDWHAVAVDQRGHGLSDKPDTGYTGSDYAADVVALIEALGDRDVVLVGHSLGARNALVTAAARPDLIRGVVAVEFTPFIDQDTFDELEARVRNGSRSFASYQELKTYLGERYGQIPEDAVLRRLRHGYRERDGKHRALADPRAMLETVNGLREDLVATVGEVRCPTVIVRGAGSGFVTAEAFERTLALRPDFIGMTIPGSDHYVAEEASARVAEAVLRVARAADDEHRRRS